MTREAEAVSKFVAFALREAEEAKRARIERNQENVEAYFGKTRQEHKLKPCVSVPKTFVAVERLSKFITKAITDAGNEFFTVTTGKLELDPEIARSLLSYHLNQIGPSGETFLQVVEKCVKLGLLKGELVAKVTGHLVEEHVKFPEGVRKVKYFKPVIEAIDPDTFFCDPSGRGLYEAQKYEADYHSLLALAEAGVYDKDAVLQLSGKGKREFRRSFEVTEFYGKFLDEDGTAFATNALAVIADGDKVLKFEEAPFWHGGSPFVHRPITTSIKSDHLVAIMDGPVALNRYLNELMSLILDSAVRASIGVNLVRTAFLEDPKDVIGGIVPGSRIRVSANSPPGTSPIENIQLGQVNPFSIQVYGILDSIFTDSSVLTDIAIGRAPPKEATATEIIQLTQSQSVLLAGFIISVEDFISKILRKLWLLVMQNLEFLKTDDVVSAIGVEAALSLSQMTQEQRFDAFSGAGFVVKGISDLLRRANDIQRYTQFLSLAFSNQVMAKAFLTRVDVYKYLNKLASLFGIDISSVLMPPEEQVAAEQAMAMQSMTQPGPERPKAEQAAPPVPPQFEEHIQR